MNKPLIIVGGSVRAAVMSAIFAGFKPVAIDRYADADLRRLCQRFVRFEGLDQLPELAESLQPGDLVFVGPLENHPEIVARLGKQHRLLGNCGAVLQAVRDPWQVAKELNKAGLPVPSLRSINDYPPSGEWLVKPFASAGGFHVERLDERTSLDTTNSYYLQQVVTGTAIGATFVAADGKSTLAGVTEQLIGGEWGGSRPFQYVGSVGPIVLSAEHADQLTQIGDVLARQFHLRGLYGVDAIVNDAGVWTVEVNPRYTASVEILERAMNVATVRWHVDACTDSQPPRDGVYDKSLATEAIHAKAVIYSRGQFVIGDATTQSLLELNTGTAFPIVADIPMAGTEIDKGDPIATVFAQGATTFDAKECLRTAIAKLNILLDATSTSRTDV